MGPNLQSEGVAALGFALGPRSCVRVAVASGGPREAAGRVAVPSGGPREAAGRVAVASAGPGKPRVELDRGC